MITRLLGGLLLITACGKQVNIDHTALKNASQVNALSLSEATVVKMTGSFNHYLKYNNNSYKISDRSSPITLDFLKSASQGETKVFFKGRVEKSEMIISEISKR